jgi:hypothetical protein
VNGKRSLGVSQVLLHGFDDFIMISQFLARGFTHKIHVGGLGWVRTVAKHFEWKLPLFLL